MCAIVAFAFCIIFALSSETLGFQHQLFGHRVRHLGLNSNAPEVGTSDSAVITLTDNARCHLKKMRSGNNNELYLRMGVKSGGCSGMSYVMDIVEPTSISADDVIEIVDDIKCVIDPKSLLYLYGLKLDYSDELIGGGFKFTNPNAETSWYDAETHSLKKIVFTIFFFPLTTAAAGKALAFKWKHRTLYKENRLY